VSIKAVAGVASAGSTEAANGSWDMCRLSTVDMTIAKGLAWGKP